MWAQGGSRDVINKLIRYYFDAKEDYRLAATRATDTAVRTELDKLVDQREQFHMQLQQEVTRHGIEMSDNGSAAADFKRDWERVRGAVAGHGYDSALKLADQSDAHAMEQIGILCGRDLPAELRALIGTQSDQLRLARTRVNDLRPGTPTTAQAG